MALINEKEVAEEDLKRFIEEYEVLPNDDIRDRRVDRIFRMNFITAFSHK